MSPTRLSATAQSNINTNRDRIKQDIETVNDELADLRREESYYYTKISFSNKVIYKCDEIIEMNGFHPIQKTKARFMRNQERLNNKRLQSSLSRVQTKIKMKEMNAMKLNQKDQRIAYDNDNTGLLQWRKVGSANVKIRDGQIDFASREGKKLTENLFDPHTGEPTPNFETLKQVLVDYPKSIMTLPDNVVQQLGATNVDVRIIQGTMTNNGSTYNMVTDKTMTAFEYLRGMTAAGFKIAEQQGRDIQANPDTMVDFAGWVKVQEDFLKNGKKKTNTNQNQNNNQTEATF